MFRQTGGGFISYGTWFRGRPRSVVCRASRCAGSGRRYGGQPRKTTVVGPTGDNSKVSFDSSKKQERRQMASEIFGSAGTPCADAGSRFLIDSSAGRNEGRFRRRKAVLWRQINCLAITGAAACNLCLCWGGCPPAVIFMTYVNFLQVSFRRLRACPAIAGGHACSLTMRRWLAWAAGGKVPATYGSGGVFGGNDGCGDSMVAVSVQISSWRI